ncbi:MAG: hypothetical protein IT158_23725 [Bryobacterales bacterium]|nr:hypothetical protein [Bryobacterales bacterium]
MVGRALERGFDYLRRHAIAGADGEFLAGARREYREAAKLLPLVYEIDEPERRRLERLLSALRSELSRADGLEVVRVRAAGG